MPWTGTGSFAFTEASVNANAPSASGVYALFNQGRWIYIGESGDIRARLLQHLRGDNACITRERPGMFAHELLAANQRVTRQNALILELRPVCNQMLG